MKIRIKALSFIWILFLLNIVSTAYAANKAEQLKHLEEITVTATKYETAVKNVPASITIIHTEQLNKQNFPNQDIGDALRSVPGVTIRRAYAPFPSAANIRGAGSGATVYLVNGIPTDYQISQAIPVEIVDRVEIIRGPASALYGANASGGVINIILKEGTESPGGALKTGYGSFDRFRTALSSDGKLDKFHYALAGYYEESDGTNVVENNVNANVHMIDDCDYDKKGATVNARYEFSHQAGLQFFYSYLNDRYTRGRPNVGGDWDYNLAGMIYNQKIGDNLNLRAYAAYRADEYLHLYDGNGTNYAPRMKRYTDSDEIPMELQATLGLGAGHTLTTGFFYNNETTEQKYRDLTGSTPGNTYRNEYKVQTLAGYVQDVWNMTDSWVATAGLRYDRWENYDNYFEKFTTSRPADRTDSSFSPKVGLRYNIDSATSLWGNYGMGFAPPTSEQLYDDRTSGGNPRQPNPDLKSETTHSWEIGMDRWFSSKIQSSITCFYNFTDDKIMSWFDASNVYINKNIGKSESYGAELCFALYPNENWMLKANYTFNIATIDDNPVDTSLEGNYLPFSPRHKVNLDATYSRPDNFTLFAGFRYLGDQYSNDANTVSNAGGDMVMMEHSFVVDLKGTKYFKLKKGPIKQIDLSLGIDNLFDEEYRSFYMYEDPGTTFFTELAFVF